MTITVVTPVSPIPSHPDISIIDETLSSVKAQLPSAELVLMFDGVRPEQEHRRAAYEEAIHRILAMQWGVAHLFDRHLHQVGMLRRIIDTIDTPLLLFVEQDTPLEPDPIDWDACCELILSGEADVVRFSHESEVHPEHRYLLREQQGLFWRTLQYSARPHLASVDYYKRVLRENFSPDANTFIEDVLHGAAQAWPDKHRIFLYHPEGNIRRSRHLDGRAGEPKYEEKLVF